MTADIPGSRSAETLIRLGLRHDDIVRGLMHELDLTLAEGEAAWAHGLERIDGECPVLMASVSAPLRSRARDVTWSVAG